MIPVNILDIKDRAQFRQWMIENHTTERECWVVEKLGKAPPEDALWYLDAVEEALFRLCRLFVYYNIAAI